MFWHVLLILCSPLAPLLSGLLRDDRDRQILALRQQLLILQRRVGKRARLSRARAAFPEEHRLGPLATLGDVVRNCRHDEARSGGHSHTIMKENL